MKSGPKSGASNGAPPVPSLTGVLGQSEHATELVKESAAELAAVNTVLQEEIALQAPPPAVAEALAKSEAVELKVEEASEKLAAINHALEGEIRDRDMVDRQLAAAKEQEEAARYASFHDILTGLPNRALFNDRLEHGCAQAKRHGRILAVMFLDLDKFKLVNDTYGHDIGDLALKTVAQRLTASVRDDDTVCRLGGDEFLYLLSEIRDQKDAGAVAAKVIKLIQEPFEATVQGVATTLKVSVSVGISIFPEHGTTVDTLIISADLAMYQAKQNAAGFAFAR